MTEYIRPPVIILGMHRSGTTLIVDLLQELKFFAGSKMRMGKHSEAFFFQRRNEWLMRRAGGAWDYPLPVKSFFQVEAVRLKAENILKKSVHSWQFVEFTGSLKDLVIKSKSKLRGSWGWKDPRNIFTLGLWSKIFPDASILYIKRNGVDVANSLYVREASILSEQRDNKLLTPLLSRVMALFRPLESYVHRSIRCTTLQGCFDLWREYIAEAETVYKNFIGRKIALRYEDVLGDPYKNLKEIAEFCNIDFKPEDIVKVASKVRTDRAYAFVKDQSLYEFYQTVRNSELMRKLDYHNIVDSV
jgi:hypothetical protein